MVAADVWNYHLQELYWALCKFVEDQEIEEHYRWWWNIYVYELHTKEVYWISHRSGCARHCLHLQDPCSMLE